MKRLGAHSLLAIGASAALVPIAVRVLSSPLLLVLLSPFLLIATALACLALTVFYAQRLDRTRSSRRISLAPTAKSFPFSSPAAWEAVLTRSQWSENAIKSYPPLHPESQAISAAVNELLSLIIRDFVLVWYREISPSPSFPNAVGDIIHESLQTLLQKASTIDLPALVVKRILPRITDHIEHYRQSEMALRGAGLERRLTQSEELDILLASRYASSGKGKLHPAISNLSTSFTRQSEEMHLRSLVNKALPLVLPRTEAKSQALVLVAREIVSCSVLYPVMEMLSDPDFWNKMIDQVAGAAIHQQRLISKVRNVLEAQSPRSHRLSSAPPSAVPAEKITIRTDGRQFESFLRSINRCSSLLDARRLKNDILGEIRRTRTSLANHENEDWINGEKTEDIVAFLDRLYTARRKVEERIVVLGGEGDSRQSIYQDTVSKEAGLSLRDVLSNPSSLSYFMEFMDRRQHSLLVQFWLTVESFKNPLESVDSSSEDDDDEAMQDPSASVNVKEDITMIHDLYFSNATPHPALAFIPQKHVSSIREFVANGDTSIPAQRKVRRSVLLAQRHVERSMEQDFEDFERSELWFRVVGDSDASSKRSLKSPPRSTSSVPKQSRSHPPLVGSQSTPFLPARMLARSESSVSVPAALKRTESQVTASSMSSASTATSRPPQPNIDLLMSGDSSSDGRAPLFDDPDDEGQRQEEQQMEAIQAAITDIIALDQEQAEDGNIEETEEVLSPISTGSPMKRRGVFNDDDAESILGDDELEDGLGDGPEEHQTFQMAGPGDLHLTYEISRLGEKIDSLETQNTMLDAFVKKAELTGDTRELKLLAKSKASLNREIRQLRFQKTQYEQQESANRLFSDRTKVSIVSSTTAEEEGKSVVRYLVEVQQLAPDGTFASGWVVARRYNEFFNMHNKLKDRYALIRNVDFPGKRLVTQFSGTFVDTRRVALEKYLQSIIAIPIVCESEELRAFLSRESPFAAAEKPSPTSKGQSSFSGTDLVRTVYKSFTESIDDMLFGPSMLDVIIQRLTRQAAEMAGIVGSGVNDEDLVTQALNAAVKGTSIANLLQLPGDLKPLEGETSASIFSAPICDLILAVFELNKENNWLRRQAIVIILQQVLGGTIERKIRENVKTQLLSESRILSYISIFREGLWPGGKLKPPSPPRSADEKTKTRDEANRKLSAVVPDFAANMIGRSNARRGARRIFAVLQNRRLNQHIVYTVVDEIFSALFPESNGVS